MKELLKKKAPFMAKVFTNLILQGAIAYAAASQKNPHVARHVLPYALIFAVAVLVMIFADLPIQARFILFTVISALFGSLLTTFRNLDPRLVQETLSDILVVFVSMFALGVVSVQFNVNVLPLAILMFMTLTGLMVARLTMSREKRGALSKAFVVLFALYIFVDTNMILQRNYDGDFVDASFDYFTDLSQIFTRLIPSDI